MQKPRSQAPIIVAVFLLLLPVLYVGSYTLLNQPTRNDITGKVDANYRLDGPFERLYWPLEQLDRKLRPKSWQDRESPVFDDVGT